MGASLGSFGSAIVPFAIPARTSLNVDMNARAVAIGTTIVATRAAYRRYRPTGFSSSWTKRTSATPASAPAPVTPPRNGQNAGTGDRGFPVDAWNVARRNQATKIPGRTRETT